MSGVLAATSGAIDGRSVDVGARVVDHARDQERLAHRRHLRATTERALETISGAAETVGAKELLRLATDEASGLRAFVEWLGQHEGCDLIVALRRVVAEAAVFGEPEIDLAPGPMDNTLPGGDVEALAREIRGKIGALRDGGHKDAITMSCQERHGEALVRLRSRGDFAVIAEFRRGAVMLSGGVARATLGHRVEEARAHERRHLRCALHDATLQTLEYLSNDGYGSELDAAEIRALAGQALMDLRQILDGDGTDECELLPGLERVVSDARRLGPVEIALVTGPIDGSVHGDDAAALVSAVREALNNVRKHASASRVIVHCEATEGEARITVRDDGVGFDPQTLTHGVGILHSIADRMTEHGGRAQLHSAPGRGVLVTLTMANGGRGA
jgi:signal transduction histidine kinase